MFTIIMPFDNDRQGQFEKTKKVYDAMPQKKEFILPTRKGPEVEEFLKKKGLGKDVRVIPYSIEAGFNCSKALNIGVRNATYSSVIITSPEVKPLTNVLSQLEKLSGNNVICQVFDEGQNGEIQGSLVNYRFRSESPRMYFLAMFNRSDIEKINGWDEEFLKGYAYEDNDFGKRWNRARIPFITKGDIQAVHQYHPRKTIHTEKTALINRRHYMENNKNKVIKCLNGLVKDKDL